MFPCPGCGASLKFNIDSQKMKCDFCGSHYEPEETTQQTFTKENSEDEKDFFEATIFTCPQCGAEMMGDDTDATAFCSYCGAANILNTRIAKEERPQCIIPFKINKSQCATLFLKDARSHFFAPKELKEEAIVDGFRGIYTPYFSYRFSQEAALSLTSEDSHRKGDYIYTNHYAHKGDLRAVYSGISYDASTVFYDEISEQIGPFDVKDVKNFNPAYLAGFYADIPDADSNLYAAEAKEIANKHTAKEVEKIFPKTSVVSEDDTKLTKKFGTLMSGIDTMMYPVWFMSYRYKDKIGYATVNGQSGKIISDYPIDKLKFLLVALLIAIPSFFILNFMPAITPKVAMVIAIVLALAFQWILRYVVLRIDERENFTNDKAVQAMLKGKKLSLAQISRIDESKSKGKKTSKKKKKQFDVSNLMWIIFLVFSLNAFILFVVAGIAAISVPVAFIVTAVFSIISFVNVKRPLPVIITVIMTLVEFVGMILFVANPPEDYLYYGVAIILFALMIPTMLYIMSCLNDLCLRPLPQFKKKGGDDGVQ